MQRFLLENVNFLELLEIKDLEIISQILKVFRSKIWDEFIFFSGEDNFDYTYKLQEINKKSLSFSLTSKISKIEPEYKINMFLSKPNKTDKIELVLQKWIEVWVSNFNYYTSDRSQKLNLSENKISRFDKIITEAMEQSGRNIKPKLTFLDKIELPEKWYFFHTSNENSKWIFETDFKETELNLFIWPEWGFSPEEIEKFESKNYKRIHLWNNILRCETCSITVPFCIKQIKEK